MTKGDRTADLAPISGWEPEPLHLPLELPYLPPEQEPISDEDEDPGPGARVIVLDIS